MLCELIDLPGGCKFFFSSFLPLYRVHVFDNFCFSFIPFVYFRLPVYKILLSLVVLCLSSLFTLAVSNFRPSSCFLMIKRRIINKRSRSRKMSRKKRQRRRWTKRIRTNFTLSSWHTPPPSIDKPCFTPSTQNSFPLPSSPLPPDSPFSGTQHVFLPNNHDSPYLPYMTE